ncbi:MAG: oligosaccharide flippase family protein [Bacteroidetes bacterium]|jgi:O-antigen/teichoic acid export membrane protein|nr:oligosaccharide flippase family protein [Bacteroidota bacterium]
MRGSALRSDYIRNLTILVTGSASAQFIGLALSPVFSRYYSPHEFGLLAVFMSILSALSVIVCLRYEFAIIPARTIEDAGALLQLSFKVTLITTLLALIGVTIFNLFLSTNADLSRWLWLLPVMTLANGLYQAMLNWANRHKNYKLISKYRIVNSIITNGIILAAALLGYISFGLLVGFVTGGICAMLVLYFNIQKSNAPFSFNNSNTKLMETARKYDVFPKVNLWQAIADMLLINGVIYFLTFFFSQVVVGLYGMTMRVLQAPFNLIGYSIGQIFLQEAAHQFHEGKNIQPLIKKSIIRTCVVALPIVIILVITGPYIFAFVFGEQWRESGEFARILAPWFFLDFIRTPISQVPVITGQQKRLFTLSIVGNLFMISSMILGGFWLNDYLMVVRIFTILQCLYLIYVIYWIYTKAALGKS